MYSGLFFMLSLAAIDSAGAGATDKFVPAGAASEVAGLPAPYFSASVPDGSSWLTDDRLKAARDVILEGGQKKKPFFMDREVPCLRDAYLLSSSGDDRIVIFLQCREVVRSQPQDGNEEFGSKPVSGKGIFVFGMGSGNGVLVKSFGMQRGVASKEDLLSWTSLLLPTRGRVDSVVKPDVKDGLCYSMDGTDPLLNRRNADAVARYILKRNPRRAMHGSMYGELPFYEIKGSPYAVFLLPKGQLAPIEKPEDVGGFSFCYRGLPNGRGAVSVMWKTLKEGAGGRMVWGGWYAPQYMLDMSCEAFLYLLREMEGAAPVSPEEPPHPNPAGNMQAGKQSTIQ